MRASAFQLAAGALWDNPLWSLTVEWQFYLVLPVIALTLKRVRRRRHVVVLLLLALVGYGLFLRGLVGLSIHTPVTELPGLAGIVLALIYGLHGKYVEVFAMGMLASLGYVWGIEQGHLRMMERRALGLLLLPASLLGLMLCAWWATFDAGRFDAVHTQARSWNLFCYAVFGEWFFAVCLAGLLFSVLCLPRSLGRLLSIRPLVWCGLISYSLYLWHLLLLRFLLNGFMWHWLPALGILLVWSAVFYRIIERPFLHYRQNRQPATAPVNAPVNTPES